MPGGPGSREAGGREAGIDSRYLVFAGVAALLVLTPGASVAVITRNALAGGRAAAVFTALGINCGNTLYALSSALGLSLLFRRYPVALETVKLAGAVYLAFLGAQSVRAAARSWHAPLEGGDDLPVASPTQGRTRSFLQGLVTNLLHPAVAMFYLTYVPQFIRPGDRYFVTFMSFAAVHVAISFSWLAFYGISIDRLGRWLARPKVRRWLEGVTGGALIGLAIWFAVRAG